MRVHKEVRDVRKRSEMSERDLREVGDVRERSDTSERGQRSEMSETLRETVMRKVDHCPLYHPSCARTCTLSACSRSTL